MTHYINIHDIELEDDIYSLRFEQDADGSCIHLMCPDDDPEFQNDNDNDAKIRYHIDLNSLDHTIPLYIIFDYSYSINFNDVKYIFEDTSAERFPLVDVDYSMHLYPEDDISASVKFKNISATTFRGNGIAGFLRNLEFVNPSFVHQKM